VWFVPEDQGGEKRYDTDTVGRLVKHGFEERQFHRIGAGARADDGASWAMLETPGFVEEGRHREHYYADDEHVDQVSYSVTFQVVPEE
jgi:RimJ/RimL family protein N-acetyltransferase